MANDSRGSVVNSKVFLSMVDENKDDRRSKSVDPVHPLFWPIVIIIGFFGGGAILFSSFWFQCLLGAGVSFLALYLYSSSPERTPARRIGAMGNLRGDEYSRIVANALQFPAFILDGQGNVVHANQASLHAFGNIGTGDRITVWFRQPQFRSEIQNALRTSKAVSFSYNEPVPNDRWFTVEVSLLANSKNTAQRFLLVFHDETENRRTDQMRSDFIANASHELRTPLASISGFIETIKGPARNDPKAIDKFTGVMLEQAERMTRLLNDLLSLSRIEMKSNVDETQKVSLSDVLKSVTDALGGTAKQLGVSLKLDLDDDDLLVIGERDSLIQVFDNLVENACKYGQDGKKVLISAKRLKSAGEEKIRVSVRDFGPGIPLEHQHRITERFYRVDVARSRETQGTGLGLAIVKNILQRHRTRLKINSQAGDGAEFSVEFDAITE